MATPKVKAVQRRAKMAAGAGSVEGGLRVRPPSPVQGAFKTPQATTGRGVTSQAATKAKAAAVKASKPTVKYGRRSVNKKTGNIEQAVSYTPGTPMPKPAKPKKSSTGTRRAS